MKEKEAVGDSSFYIAFLSSEEINEPNILEEIIKKQKFAMVEKIKSLNYHATKISYLLNSIITLQELQKISALARENEKIIPYFEEKEYFKKEGKKIINSIKNKPQTQQKLFDIDI